MFLARLFNTPAADEAETLTYRLTPLRLLVCLLIIPFAIPTLGAATVTPIILAILAMDALLWFLTRPFAGDSETGARRRSAIMAATFLSTLAWLSLSIACWLDGHPALKVTAVAMWTAMLLYEISFLHASRTLMLVVSVPVILVGTILPIATPIGGDMADLWATAAIVTFFIFAVVGGTAAYYKRGELRTVAEELEQQKSAAEAANRSKSAFLATMSHEIRTPLNGVLGMAQSLRGEQLTPEQEEKVSTIIESGETLMTILNDVLDLSKIEAGRVEISETPTDLRHKLSRVYRLFQPRAEEKGLCFTFDVDDNVPQFVNCDPIRVRQCFSNLVSNALKFTEVGEVATRVSCEQMEPEQVRIVLTIRDSGIGMSEQTQQQLFSEFTQAEDNASRRYGGTGLGLAIARRLAALMHGEITVESRLGAGSTFTFSFPAQVGEQLPAPVPAKPQSDLALADGIRGKRVLLVDDNAVNRKVAMLFLKYSDMDVVEAGDGLVALDMLGKESFDLVLLDMHMPVMDGEETIRLLRESDEEWRNIPVIALTADVVRGDLARYKAMGMQGLVTKPIAQEELISEISRVLGGNYRIASPEHANDTALPTDDTPATKKAVSQ